MKKNKDTIHAYDCVNGMTYAGTPILPKWRQKKGVNLLNHYSAFRTTDVVEYANNSYLENLAFMHEFESSRASHLKIATISLDKVVAKHTFVIPLEEPSEEDS